MGRDKFRIGESEGQYEMIHFLVPCTFLVCIFFVDARPSRLQVLETCVH